MQHRLSQVRPPSQVRDNRKRAVKIRHWLLGQPAPSNPLPRLPLTDPKPGRVGIALSGGGIRSAAYNLGALQVLRDKGVFGNGAPDDQPEPDVLVAAVSGGSYIASAFATVAAKSTDSDLAPRDGAGPEPDGAPAPRRIYAPSSPEEVHLRNHSSYIAPGLGGKLRLALRVLMGMLANFAVIGVVVAIVGAALGIVYGEGFGQLARANATGALHPPAIAWLLPLGLLGLGAVLLLPDLFKRLYHDSVRRFCEAWATRLIVVGLACGVVAVAIPQLILWVRGFSWTWAIDVAGAAAPAAEGTVADRATGVLQTLNLSAVLTAAAGALRVFVARKRSYFALVAGAVAGPLTVFVPIVWVANASAVGGFGAGDARLLAALVGAGLIAWLVVDLNQWSLHPYYRRRLSSAFFVRRVGPDKVEEWPYDAQLRVSEVDGRGRFPELIVCAAANVSDHGATPPGRSATPFTFCRQDIGGPLVSACTARFYEQHAARASRDVTLPAAVAMSGAAFAPVMGKRSIRALTFLLALTNLRLGVWLPNPQHVEALATPRLDAAPTWARELPGAVETCVRRAARRLLERLVPERRHHEILDKRCRPAWERAKAWVLGRRPRPHYLFKEMLGRTRLADRFLYVTDGGHFDNLGVVELLRRGCTTVYCLDAGGDAPGSYTALGEAIALARSELQVDIDVDPSPIDAPSAGAPPATDHVIGRIRYRATPTGTGEVTGDAGGCSPFVGRIVYCRATVTAQAPFDVRAFQAKDARFPHHSTFDQLFDDEKFESYRALGAHTTARAIDTLRRSELRDAARRVLVDRARRRATIRQHELIAAVHDELPHVAGRTGGVSDADRWLLRSLVDEIGAAEASAQRPPLALIVQDRRPREPEPEAQLAQVWDYWAPERPAAVDDDIAA